MLVHARAMGIQVHRVPVLRPASGKAARRASSPAIAPEAGHTPPPARAEVAPQPTDKKPAAKKVAAKKPAAKQVAVKKAAATKAAAKKTAAKKQAMGVAKVESAAPASKTAAKKVPASQAATRKAAASKLPAKKTPSKKAWTKAVVQAAPGAALAAANVAGQDDTSASASVVTPIQLQHVIESLRKMANKRPARVTGLRGAIKSLLGETATTATIDAAMRSLVDLGWLDLGAAPKVTFPKFGDGKAATT